MKFRLNFILISFLIFILFFNYCRHDSPKQDYTRQKSQDNNFNNFFLDSLEKLKMAKYDPPFGLSWESNLDTIQSKFSEHYRFVSKNYYKDEKSTEFLFEGEYAGFYNCQIFFQTFNDTLLAFGASIPTQGQFPIAKTWKSTVDLMTDKYGNPDSIALPKQDILTKAQFDSIYPETRNKERIAKTIELCNSLMSSGTMMDASIQNGDWQPLAKWEFSNAVSVVSVNLDKPNKFNFREPSVFWVTFNYRHLKAWNKIRNDKTVKNSEY
jgi:hypothetical protein